MCRPILTAMALVAVASLVAVVPADAIQVQDMKEFKSIQGRYGPKGAEIGLTYDGRALVFLPKKDADPISVSTPEIVSPAASLPDPAVPSR